MVVSFIGGGNQSTLSKSPTYRKSLTNFLDSLFGSLNVYVSSTPHHELDSNSQFLSWEGHKNDIINEILLTKQKTKTNQ